MNEDGLALVTGAAGGIGSVIAGRLAEAGHSLLLVDRDPEVAQTARRLETEGVGAEACVADITAEDEVRALADRVRESGAPLRVLVNNAGITRDARVGDMDVEAFRTVVEVNLVGAMRLTFAVEDQLAEGGAIVNMSSRAYLGNFGQVNYSASKSGLVGFTRAMALRLAPRVRVNAIAPGLIDTPMTEAMPDRVREKLVAQVPAGRIGTPHDIAEIVAFLASPAADYVTGQVLVGCGGRSIAA